MGGEIGMLEEFEVALFICDDDDDDGQAQLVIVI